MTAAVSELTEEERRRIAARKDEIRAMQSQKPWLTYAEAASKWLKTHSS